MGRGCHCGGSCCQDESAGLGYLAAITADEAAQQAMPLSTVSGTAGFTQDVYSNILEAAQTGQFQSFDPSGCTGQSGAASDLKLTGVAGGLALQGIGVGAAIAGPGAALAPITLGVSIAITALVGLFSTIYAHHAAAVAAEQKIICAAVPAAENYLQVIEQAVQTGVQTPQQGIAALNSLLSDFKSTVASILKDDSSHCNAACVWIKELTAIVAYQTSQYQDMITQQSANQSAAAVVKPNTVTTPAPATSSYASFYSAPGAAVATPAPAPAASLPSWLPIAAAATAAFLFMEAL